MSHFKRQYSEKDSLFSPVSMPIHSVPGVCFQKVTALYHNPLRQDDIICAQDYYNVLNAIHSFGDFRVFTNKC